MRGTGTRAPERVCGGGDVPAVASIRAGGAGPWLLEFARGDVPAAAGQTRRDHHISNPSQNPYLQHATGQTRRDGGAPPRAAADAADGG